MPQVNMALAAASVWFAVVGDAIRPTAARTSFLIILSARSVPHRGRRCLSTKAAACRQDLFLFLAYSFKYRSWSSANVPALRSARRSATGCFPWATSRRTCWAILRASPRPIHPTWYHHARPRVLYTILKFLTPVG